MKDGRQCSFNARRYKCFFLRENYPNSIPRENAQSGCFDHPFFVVLLNIFVQVVFLNLND